jgi:hypothetical protein
VKRAITKSSNGSNAKKNTIFFLALLPLLLLVIAVKRISGNGFEFA